jgi:hypothetical protein
MRYPCRSHLRNQFLQHFGQDLLKGHLLDAKVVLVLVEEEEADDALLVNSDCLLERMTYGDSVNYVADHRNCHSRSCASRVAQQDQQGFWATLCADQHQSSHPQTRNQGQGKQ